MIQPEFGYSFQIGNILVDEIYVIFIRRVYINQRRCLRLGKVVLQLIKMETLKKIVFFPPVRQRIRALLLVF